MKERKKGRVIVYLRNSLARNIVKLRSESGNTEGFLEHVLRHIKNSTYALLLRSTIKPIAGFWTRTGRKN
jgi:hypothetical protein